MTDNENLPALPMGWCWTTLGEISKSLNPGFPSGKHNQENLGIPHLRPMNINSEGKIDLSIVKYVEISRYEKLLKGDVLFNNTNSPILLGKTAYIAKNTNWAYSNHMTRIRFLENLINSEFISRYLHYLFYIGYFQIHCTNHVNQASISKTFLEQNVYVPLPPLPEQHRIVQKIEELFTDLDAGVQELEKAKVQIKNYRQTVLKAAFEGKLVQTENELAEKEKQNYETAYELLENIIEIKRHNSENRKIECEKPYGPANNSLPNLPKGWCWTNLEQLKSFSLYGPRFSSKDYSEEGYLVLRTSDISESGKVDINSAPKLNLSRETFLKYKIEIGDLLITRSGSLGTLAVFNDNVESIPGAYLIHYRLVSNSIMSWYIFYYFKSSIGQKRLLSGGAGVGRPNLNAPTIEAIEIPIAPLAEQQRIVSEIERRFSVVDQIEKTIDQSLIQAEKLRQSILKKAFEGKLVPQDSNDETASVLLERIKQEKGRAESREKPGKKTKMKAETVMETSGKTKQAELF